MSMSAVRNARPGNRKRAIAHAPAMPKTRFSSTATGATSKVSLIECSVSRSLTRLSQYTRSPAEKASTKTTTSGITTRNVMTATAAAIRSRRTIGGSSWARMYATDVVGWSAMMARAPAFDEVDREQRDERDEERSEEGRVGREGRAGME